mmetsp:Transcript_27036/g.81614  ORF Transcript_27036/g.81614 Transcript_27036/m.81614 type:complete len:204 (-) Transcript_27036:36-647(-)
MRRPDGARVPFSRLAHTELGFSSPLKARNPVTRIGFAPPRRAAGTTSPVRAATQTTTIASVRQPASAPNATVASADRRDDSCAVRGASMCSAQAVPRLPPLARHSRRIERFRDAGVDRYPAPAEARVATLVAGLGGSLICGGALNPALALRGALTTGSWPSKRGAARVSVCSRAPVCRALTKARRPSTRSRRGCVPRIDPSVA